MNNFRRLFTFIWRQLHRKERIYLRAGLFSILALAICVIIILPIFLTNSWFYLIDFSTTGEIGDTIGGISTPFIGFLGAILTFLAFYIQYKANAQQREQFQQSLDAQKKQLDLQNEHFEETKQKQKDDDRQKEKIWKIERFENKFYELLRVHKANVSEMNIADVVQGRKCFVPMYHELRFCFKILEGCIHDYGWMVDIKNVRIMSLTFKIFFFGIGHYSEKNFIGSLNSDEITIFGEAKKRLNLEKREYRKRKKKRELPNTPITESLPGSDPSGDIDYTPFDGHVHRLGHYFRHLFQTARFVVDQDFDDATKYSYIKMLRAQLSNFEQLMIYYNAVAWFDSEWRDIFTTFRLIKNLPIPLVDFGPEPREHFADDIARLQSIGIVMFELDE